MQGQSGDNISVLMVDDQNLVRSGIARLLDDMEGIQVIGQLASGEEAIDYLVKQGRQRPDVLLLDARMPGIGGIETTQQLLAHDPKLRIVAISTVASGVIPSQMLRVGALAFVSKGSKPAELERAIRMVERGEHYLEPAVATQLAVDPFNSREQGPFDKLSRRELQIAQLLTDGKRVSQIAGYLDLSPKTVYSYRYRIFEKLNITSDVELTLLAVKHGMVDPHAVAH